jgi:hypothetical protein
VTVDAFRCRCFAYSMATAAKPATARTTCAPAAMGGAARPLETVAGAEAAGAEVAGAVVAAGEEAVVTLLTAVVALAPLPDGSAVAEA